MGIFINMSENRKDFFRVITALIAIFGFLFLFSCGTEYDDVTYPEPPAASSGSGSGDSGGYGKPDSFDLNP